MRIVCGFVAALILSVSLVQAQTAPASEPVPLVFWNRQIHVFRSYFNQQSPAERAAKARERLASLPADASEWRVTSSEATIGQYTGVIVSVNDQQVFAILVTDLDQESNETLQAASDRVTAQLQAALDARAQQRSIPRLLRGIGLSIAATLILLFALWLVMRATRRFKGLQAREQARKIALAGFDIQPALHSLRRTLTNLTGWALAAFLIYLWLTFVLLRFPYSQPWGQQLGAFLLSIFTTLGAGILNSIPGLFTVVVIFLLTRVIVRVVNRIFQQIQSGDLTVPWLHADTARATRYLVIILVWIFAIVVAYPYVPGSNTDAFKGVSVLLGVMLSLGSAGLVNQIMSGLVVVYSRALRPGDFVQIGDDFGIVTDVGMLSTKIVTRKKEEITIPHAVLVAAKTVNYSRHATNGQAQLGTTITIGYDAPWRQVHELLLAAASKTTGVRPEPAPRVWQKALSNFYVEYELVVNLDHPEERLPILSELHMHIQDAFNEAGVQIMSPAFESQPEKKIVVPKSQWFPTPAELAAEPNGAEQPASSEVRETR
ncbi:MAG TPA: mechanosensitive ion channel domain-containing protein [Pyrinomonadaceae bacterium]|nr:mechanosensitive ion channel domain-containing protein [Pyrinomonadaceae bacterium]